MSFFSRRKPEMFFLIGYVLWLAWLQYYMHFKPRPVDHFCDYTPVFLVVLTVIFALAYSLALLIRYFAAKDLFRNEYLFFIGLVHFSLLLVLFM